MSMLLDMTFEIATSLCIKLNYFLQIVVKNLLILSIKIQIISLTATSYNVFWDNS